MFPQRYGSHEKEDAGSRREDGRRLNRTRRLCSATMACASGGCASTNSTSEKSVPAAGSTKLAVCGSPGRESASQQDSLRVKSIPPHYISLATGSLHAEGSVSAEAQELNLSLLTHGMTQIPCP